MRQLVLSLIVGLITLGACTRGDAGQKKEGAPLGRPVVVFETNKGKIVVKLYGDKAPISTRNMLEYVERGALQRHHLPPRHPRLHDPGGWLWQSLDQKPTKDPIKNEADNGLSNKRGTVAMARTNVVDSATAQFFINVKDNRQLDHSHETSATRWWAR